MNRFAVVLVPLLLAACAEQPRYALEAPVPPPSDHPVRIKPPHGAEVPQAPANVGSAGPLRMAMVGTYMDAQESDFRARLRGQGIAVARIGDDIVLSARDDVLFIGDALSDRGRGAIERVAELLRHYDHSAIQVAGHTDTSGTPIQNYEISGKRAKLVADMLIADGVAAERVSSQGFGAGHLKIATGLNANEPRNRRIEIHVIAHPAA